MNNILGEGNLDGGCICFVVEQNVFTINHNSSHILKELFLFYSDVIRNLPHSPAFVVTGVLHHGTFYLQTVVGILEIHLCPFIEPFLKVISLHRVRQNQGVRRGLFSIKPGNLRQVFIGDGTGTLQYHFAPFFHSNSNIVTNTCNNINNKESGYV